MYSHTFCYKKDIISNKKNNFFCLCCFKNLRYNDINYTKTNKAVCNFCKVDSILFEKNDNCINIRKKIFGEDSNYDNSRYVSIKGGFVTVTELINNNNKKIITSY